MGLQETNINVDVGAKKNVNGFFKALTTSKKSKRIASRQSFDLTFSSVGQMYPWQVAPQQSLLPFPLDSAMLKKKNEFIRKWIINTIFVNHNTIKKIKNMSSDFEMKKNTSCCTIVAILAALLLPNVLYS